MQVALIEDRRGVTGLVQDGTVEDPHTRFISLNPLVSHLLDLQKIPYKTLRDYGGEGDRVQDGLKRFRELEHLTSYLDKELRIHHGIPALTPCQYATYNLKILFDSLHCSVDILQRILEQEDPEVVRIYSSDGEAKSRSSYGLAENEPLFSTILRLNGWPVPIKLIPPRFERETQSSTRDIKGSGRSWGSTLFRDHDLLFNAGIVLKRGGIPAAIEMSLCRLLARRRDPVLIYGSGYNWDDALLELSRANCLPIHRITDEQVFRPGNTSRTFEREVLDLLQGYPESESPSRFGDIEVRSFLDERMARIVGWSIAESIAMYTLVRETIIRKGIRCLLLSAHDSPGGHAAVQAARDSRIPVISWQHGGAGYCYHPMMPYIEFLHSDIHLVFGEGVAKEYRGTVERLGLKGGPRFIPLGSGTLDRFRNTRTMKGRPPDTAPIAYVTTSFLNKKFYFISQGFDPVTWDEHLWSVQKRVAELAHAHKNRSFILKLHPSHTDQEPIRSFITERGIENIRIVVQEHSIPDLVRKSAAVLLDHVTTGILEAALYPLPLFVYVGLGGIEGPALQSLSHRAYLSGTIDGFIGGVEQFLRRGPVEPDPSLSHGEFLRAYGTHADDGRSAARAAGVVRETVMNWKSPAPSPPPH